MKYITKTAITFAILIVFFSCKKDKGNGDLSTRNLREINQSSIIGKWGIVTDSAYTGFAQNQQPYDYAGKAGDYFDFRSDGKVYTKEGNVLDTSTYSFESTNQIVISSFGGTLNGVHQVSDITTTNTNQIVIFARWVYTPGGVFGRKVTLSN